MKKGTFTSEWDNGVFTTPAELDEVTGEITTESIDVQGCEQLFCEYFTDEAGNDYQVCGECHTHITKTIMIPGVGKTLNEVVVCTDPECIDSEQQRF